MKRYAQPLLFAVFCCFLLLAHAGAQGNKIEIAAGTPEDHDLQAITNEQDAAKKIWISWCRKPASRSRRKTTRS